MPAHDRPLFGWNNPARGLLIILVLIFGSALAWCSTNSQGGKIEPPSLSVDANSAPAAVLGALPGLGPALSGRIVEARSIQPFRSLDDFDRRVYGIGPAKVAALRPFLRFDPPTVAVPSN